MTAILSVERRLAKAEFGQPEFVQQPVSGMGDLAGFAIHMGAAHLTAG